MHARHRGWGRAWTALAAGAVAAGLSLVAAPAQATDTSIDQWHETACSALASYDYCLWYHPGQGTGGAGYGGVGNIADLTPARFFLHGNPGNQGLGLPVRNDVGSASAGCYSCAIYLYVYKSYQGDSNSLGNGYGGNLTSTLRNNEASVKVVPGG